MLTQAQGMEIVSKITDLVTEFTKTNMLPCFKGDYPAQQVNWSI
jgi:hypothetical protein